MPQFITQLLGSLPPAGILAVLCGIAFLENIFPPSPSDIVIVFGGTLAGVGVIGFIPALLLSTLGSVGGFLTAFWIGRVFGARMVERGRVRFVSLEAVHRVEEWFRKYGYTIIVVNRFLSGTRAVVSFVAGMSDMPLGITALLSAVSALAWNALLLGAGMELGHNWYAVVVFLESYGKVVTASVVVLLLVFVVRWLYSRREGK